VLYSELKYLIVYHISHHLSSPLALAFSKESPPFCRISE
jgi:hypothetical protein